MAAFAGESPNLVWQRVKGALATFNASPGALEAFKGLKLYLSTQKGNALLQYIAFAAEDLDAANGFSYLSSASTIYGVYVKKRDDASRNTVKLYADATDDTTAGDAKVALDITTAKQEAFQMWSDGMAVADGIVGTTHETLLGTTDGVAADSGDGFIIIGA